MKCEHVSPRVYAALTVLFPLNKEKATALYGGRLVAASIEGQDEDNAKCSSVIEMRMTKHRPCMEAA